MSMQHLKNTTASTLYWVQPKWGKPVYELRSGKELLSTLRWSTYISYDPAYVVSADGQWTLTYQWPWTVRVMREERDVAVFKFKKSRVLLFDGTLQFANGSKFRWRNEKWYSSRWAFSSDDGTILIYFKPIKVMSFKLTIQVDLAHEVKDLPEASLLAGLGIYLWIRINGASDSWVP